MKNLARNQQGLSILEVLLGLAMITLVGSFFISGILSMKKVAVNTGTRNALYKQINDVIENIRPNVRMYQVSYFETDEEREEALNPDTLPMAWGDGIISTRDLCPGCPGRYGYVIQSYPGISGLYLVTVRLTHREWARSDEGPDREGLGYGHVDYQFVVNTQ